MLQKVFLILFMVLLSGCAHLNSDFDCPMKPGISCQSLDQVNERINQGEIGNQGSRESNVAKPLLHYSSLQTIKNQNKPLRDRENIMRIWVAPYEDTSGNYHTASEVFSVIKPGEWMSYPVIKIKNEG